jgi:acetoin utilization protein AcuB
MTEEPLVVRPETNLEAAARILLERRIRRLPVVDAEGRLAGMFSRRDVIKAALVERRRRAAATGGRSP